MKINRVIEKMNAIPRDRAHEKEWEKFRDKIAKLYERESNNDSMNLPILLDLWAYADDQVVKFSEG